MLLEGSIDQSREMHGTYLVVGDSLQVYGVGCGVGQHGRGGGAALLDTSVALPLCSLGEGNVRVVSVEERPLGFWEGGADLVKVGRGGALHLEVEVGNGGIGGSGEEKNNILKETLLLVVVTVLG